MNGGESAQVFDRHIIPKWKPVLWYTKGECDHLSWCGDLIDADASDKRFHRWGQSVGQMEWLVRLATVPGQIILDPFCGGGTTGVAALRLQRMFIGVDIDQTAIAQTAARLKDAGDRSNNTQNKVQGEKNKMLMRGSNRLRSWPLRLTASTTPPNLPQLCATRDPLRRIIAGRARGSESTAWIRPLARMAESEREIQCAHRRSVYEGCGPSPRTFATRCEFAVARCVQGRNAKGSISRHQSSITPKASTSKRQGA